MWHPMRPGPYGERLNDLVRDHLQGKTNLIGVEIGSYAGESTSVFVNSGVFKKLYCVDPWEMNYDPSDWAGDAGITEAEAEFDRKFQNNQVVEKLKMKSHDAVQRFADSSLDFIYIDACHQYDAVMQDLADWVPKVKPGGILAGHDYNCPGITGVQRAVDEFFGHKPLNVYWEWSWVNIKE